MNGKGVERLDEEEGRSEARKKGKCSCSANERLLTKQSILCCSTDHLGHKNKS